MCFSARKPPSPRTAGRASGLLAHPLDWLHRRRGHRHAQRLPHPIFGEWILGLPNPGFHFGFIEQWWLVNPLAFIGIALGVWSARTRIPHGLHVWISTGASLFHVAMAMDGGIPSIPVLAGIALFLFLSVWIPCCTSDIVFPLLFAPDKNAAVGCCHHHHSH